MDFHFQGVQYLQGQLAVVGSIVAEDSARIPLYLPAAYAHTMGCALIELAVLAQEREAELRRTGQVLDVNTMVAEFGARVSARLKLNGSDATVTPT